MVNQRNRIGSIQKELLGKSREAAQNAVQSFNNPLITFKTETFIILMVVAWTYLLHAYYRSKNIDYRYYDNGEKKRKFHRTKSGAYKYWELEQCLKKADCPLDSATKHNLYFLIGLRHEIEHHKPTGLDKHLSGRYLACCINYERAITELFGDKYGLGDVLTFTLQFRDITKISLANEVNEVLPSNITKYIQDFDTDISADDYKSLNYSYRLFFIPKLTAKKGQADQAFEFISKDSELAKTIDREYWVLKEVESKKFRRKDIIKMMNDEGFLFFNRSMHTKIVAKMDARNPNKGYGVEVVNGVWLWYERWIEIVRKYCKENAEQY